MTDSSVVGAAELRFVDIEFRGEVQGVAKVVQTGTGTGETTSGEGTATDEAVERREEVSNLGEVGGEEEDKRA